MTPGTTTPELEAGEVLKGLKGLLETDLPQLVNTVKELTKAVEPLKGFDPKKLVDDLAETKASQEKMADAIAKGANGGYALPGLGDEVRKRGFGIMKLCKLRIDKAPLTKGEFEKRGAGFEFEALSQLQKKFGEDWIKNEYIKSQNVGDDELGGLFVPDQVIPEVIPAIYSASQIISLGSQGKTRARVLDGLVGGEVSIPQFLGGMVSTWIGETEAGAETLAKVAKKTMKPHKCGSYVVFTEDMLRMTASSGLEQFVRADLVESVAKLIDYTALYGKGGDHEPLGLIGAKGIRIYRAEDGKVFDDVETAKAEGSPNWQGGILDFTGLSRMQLALKRKDVAPNSSWAWISSPDFFHLLRNLRVSYFNNQAAEKAYLLTPFATVEQLRAIIGEFGESNRIPFNNLPGESFGLTTASTTEEFTDVFGANWDQYLVGRWGGIEIADDGGRGTGFLRELTYVRIRQRMDMRPRQNLEFIVCPDARATEA